MKTFRSKLEFELNPGPVSLFVGGFTAEVGASAIKGYRCFSLLWWLNHPAEWRSWLWAYENSLSDKQLAFFQLRVLGLEVTWEHKKTKIYMDDF